MLGLPPLTARMALLACVLASFTIGCGSMGEVGRRSEGILQSAGFRGVPKQSEPEIEEAGSDRE